MGTTTIRQALFARPGGPLALGETVSNPQWLPRPNTECRPSARNSGSPSVPPPTAAHKSQAPCAPARDQDLQCTPPSPTNKTRALGTYASSPDRFRESLGCGSRRRTSHPPSAVAPFPDKGDGFPSPGQQRSTPPSHPDEAMDPRVSSETVTPRHACPATMHEDSANFALSRNSWLLWPPLRWRACCSCEIKDSSCYCYL